MVVSSCTGAPRLQVSGFMIPEQDLRDIGLDGSVNDYKAPCQRMCYTIAESVNWKCQLQSSPPPFKKTLQGYFFVLSVQESQPLVAGS